jgi:hypothetical protein
VLNITNAQTTGLKPSLVPFLAEIAVIFSLTCRDGQSHASAFARGTGNSPRRQGFGFASGHGCEPDHTQGQITERWVSGRTLSSLAWSLSIFFCTLTFFFSFVSSVSATCSPPRQPCTAHTPSVHPGCIRPAPNDNDSMPFVLCPRLHHFAQFSLT